jgi:obg-like ATPase 1
MPPKKKTEDTKKPLLGRPSNNVKMGIVGLPNVGKSSFFNIICDMDAEAANFPFCTIDPNVSRVPVPDARFDELVASHKPKSVVPAVLTVTDIAGLVKGASEGAGLGNAFLSHIAAVDGIFHMVRAFGNGDEVTHVEGDVDPVRDMEIIEGELRKKDLARLDGMHDDLKRFVDRGVKEKKPEYEALVAAKEWLEAGKDIRDGDWTGGQIEWLNTFQLLTAKPMMYLVNLSEKHFLRKSNKWLPKIAEFIKSRGGAKVIPFSVEFESKLHGMSPEDRAADCKDVQAKSMMPTLGTAGYPTLDLIHYFTAGPDEVRAWTIRDGLLAPQAAGVIHTDFEKGFISADVMSFDAWKEHGSESAVKAAGKLRMEGRKYEVKDGDIMHFKFNVSKGKGK